MGTQNLVLNRDDQAIQPMSIVVHEPRLSISPIRPDYREVPITEGFDWNKIMGDAKRTHDLDPAKPGYLVVFRSQLAPDADVELLRGHDSAAHIAAMESPALIHYFADTPDEHGKAISFCLWSDQEEAKSISKDSRHRAATQMVRMYTSYSLEKYDVYYDDGVRLVEKSLV